MTSESPPDFLLARCTMCAGLSYPPGAWGCRACGAHGPALRPEPLAQPARLRNFVTVHAELAPGLPVPCVVGEVELAPGLVEEAVIDVAGEEVLALGMALQPRRHAVEGAAARWVFVPAGTGEPR